MQKLIDANKLDNEFERFCPQECGICSIPCNDASCPLIGDAETVLTIPDNPTNGDVIKAMFNPYKICEYEYSVHIYMTEKDFWKADYLMNCSTRWWNAPYKGESDG